jgi:two-component system, OmpR family, copper resistance phosphate regulon response regulator CusR
MSIRILVVEDEADLADFVVRGLREEGFTIEYAADGKSGWEAMEAEGWDLIILDWWLPDEDGLDLVRRYRESGASTPILFLTARDSVADRVRGLDGGADDYLCKPFAFDELLARIRALVRRRERVLERTISHADVTVDLATHRALRAGHTLDLTAKELALLTFFLRHPRQLLSRTRIYDHVWNERFDGMSNTLEVHVMELRRKLEAHGTRLIHNVRGRGYVFDDARGAQTP